jgi:hypothetical protein
MSNFIQCLSGESRFLLVLIRVPLSNSDNFFFLELTTKISKIIFVLHLFVRAKMLICGILLILCVFNVHSARWTIEEANQWYRNQPVYFGANFVPSTSVNVIDMWQTFDTLTIDRELKWASQINMNIMRVFLHVLFYEQNAENYYKKMNDFLDIADRYKIQIMFVLFDECWLPIPKLGPQLEPIPGVHNSQWVRCPGDPWLLDRNKWTLLKQ